MEFDWFFVAGAAVAVALGMWIVRAAQRWL
jgi:hypothetical protein